MNKLILTIVILSVLVLIAASLTTFFYLMGNETVSQKYTGNYVEVGGKRITAEVARTWNEMQKGLMFRESLCDECGMLFVFGEEGFHSFWMKNTLIPLDMVFIDTNMTVVDVLHAAPCMQDPCRTYVPKSKALYVLEVNGGTFDEKIIGEKVKTNISVFAA